MRLRCYYAEVSRVSNKELWQQDLKCFLSALLQCIDDLPALCCASRLPPAPHVTKYDWACSIRLFILTIVCTEQPSIHTALLLLLRPRPCVCMCMCASTYSNPVVNFGRRGFGNCEKCSLKNILPKFFTDFSHSVSYTATPSHLQNTATYPIRIGQHLNGKAHYVNEVWHFNSGSASRGLA